METALIVAIIAVAIVAGLALSGALKFPGNGSRQGAVLRELLLERAAGKIGEEEFLRRQAALHAALLEPRPASGNKLLWWIIPVAAVFAAIGFYLSQGKSGAGEAALPMGMKAENEKPMLAAPAPTPGQTNSGGDLGVMAKRLAEKLDKDPGNGEGWLLLARTYRELQQPKEAAAAYVKAAALQSLDATALADWVDAHVIANARQWDTEAKRILQLALKAGPRQPKVLSLAGSEAFGRTDYKAAIAYWKRAREAAPAGSMEAKLADANIHEAEAMLSGKKPATASAVNRPARSSPGS